MNNYTILHLHSDTSNGVTNIDSITKYNQYVDKAKELGMTAMAFSEHGSVFEWVKKKEAVEKAGMKYIHAEEFYVTESLQEKIRDNYHCLLIAKNYDGVKELNILSSKSFNREDGHYYYSPRITYDELTNTSDNIIISTACLGGILATGNNNIRKRFIEFLKDNKHRCYLEIQHHNVDRQKKYNQYLYKLGQKYNLNLVAMTDTHALNKEHLEGRKILQKAKNIYFDNEKGWDLVFKSYDELIAAYELQGSLPMDIVKQAIENTNVIADSIEPFELDRSYKYPHLWEDSEKLLWTKIKQGLKNRGVDKYPNRQEYADRIRYEMQAYKHNGAIDFMLLMEDIVSWCRTQDIHIGYGRGSVNGSVIAWVLGITEMDSIKHKLNFERFMNVERVSLSDIDTDFPPSRIEEVKQYIFNHHGLYCSDIITFNTIADKGAIRDVGRALELPLSEVSAICDTVDNEEAYAKSREQYPELFRYVDLVKGVIVSIGNHPCGMVVSPQPLEDSMGLCSTSTDNCPISQIYMKEIDSLNYVKLDLLKLDTIELISDTCDMAGIPMLLPDDLDINDVDVWNSMRDDTTAIFQWEGKTGDDYIKKLLSDKNIKKFQELDENVDRMTLLSIGNSAIRPAGASYRDDLANGIVRTTGNEAIDDFLKPTFGYLVFQCQIIEFLNQYCGFTMGEADVVRRCVDGNTLITMANGKRKKIKDINIGDQVMTLNESSGAFTYNYVNDVYCNGKKDIIEITTQHNHTLRLTGNHKILTQNGWIEAALLTTNDYIMLPMRNHGYSDKKRPSERLQCSDMFLIGMLMGDGTIGRDKSDLRFTNSDLELIEKYKDCVNHRLKNKSTCEFAFSKQKGVDVDYIYAVRIVSINYRDSVWNNLIINMGLNCKSADKHIPDELMNYPCGEKLLSLLGGLFSTDGGYVEASKVIEYYTISEELAYDIQFLLGKFNIYSYVYISSVKNYGYKCYKVRISQKDAIIKFGNIILPFVVGKKIQQFQKIITERNKSSATSVRMNYYFPKIYMDEIRKATEDQDISLLSMGFSGSTNNAFSDIKIRKVIDKIYAPKTYKLLMSEYMPVKITNIQDAGEAYVYDLSVDTNHNYIANGLIVHNCFAKKTGTEGVLPVIKNGGYLNDKREHYIDGFIATMKKRYNMTEDQAEQTITAFLQVILDASDYLFSLNHSQPYSYEGYACGYLRYYYPVEFLTCALNINKDNEDKTIALTAYAKKQDINISPIRFRYSIFNYSCDPTEHIIYKGLASIKFMNETVSQELYNLRDNTYDSFIDLLKDIGQTSCNSRQLDILIKLNFFEEFGEINQLLKTVELYDYFKKGEAKQLTKSKVPNYIPEYLLSKYCTETEKQYKIIDCRSLLKDILAIIDYPKTTISQKIKYQQEYLGYIQIVLPKLPPDYYYVTDVNGKWVTMYQLCSGNTIKQKFKSKPLDIAEGSMIRIDGIIQDRKWGKDDNGYWYRKDELEDLVSKYKILTEKT